VGTVRLRAERDAERASHTGVERSPSGEIALRWTAAGMLLEQQRCRRVRSRRQLPHLLVTFEHTSTRPPWRTPAANTAGWPPIER